MSILKLSLITFILYAPVTVMLRNKANKIINNNSEIWIIKNNSKMMSLLKRKNKLLYWLMQVETIIFTTFIACIISEIVNKILTMFI